MLIRASGGLLILALSAEFAFAKSVPLPVARPGSAEPPAAVAVPMPAPSPQPAHRGTVPHQAVSEAAELAAAPRGGEAPLVREVVSRLRNGDLAGATAIRDQLRDPASRALVEWLAIRSASRQVGFPRIAAFLRDNPNWPGSSLIRRRAEEALYLENIDIATIRGFFHGTPPISALGRLAAARAAKAAGDRAAVARFVRSAWRDDDLTPDIETRVLSEFSGVLTGDDHVYRAERLFYDNKVDLALRAASRAGSAYKPVAAARAAVARRAKNASAALAAVPASGRRYWGYRFAAIDNLLRQDKIAEAARLMLEVPRDPASLIDPKAWWEKRRWLARDLLDRGDTGTAYRIAAQHPGVAPAEIADAEFHAGWIALRFQKDPATALRHFSAIEKVAVTPLTRSRAFYWKGRALEAAGDRSGAQHEYTAAAHFGTTYYGQLARGRIGGGGVQLTGPSAPSAAARAAFAKIHGARGLELLYQAGAREEALPLLIGLTRLARDSDTFALLGEIAQRNRDPRALLIVGKAAVANGHPLETLSWPTNGIPPYQPRGPAIEAAVVHAIARQESAFHAAAISRANARGLLQLLPATARKTAKLIGLPFDAARLTRDPAYNATLGAAHLGELASDYGGSYIMTFAAYNAGPRRVAQWVERYGDPRDPGIDPVDWVERIPFGETRNYVQRVMENVQVYRARLGHRSTANIEADLRRGGTTAIR